MGRGDFAGTLVGAVLMFATALVSTGRASTVSITNAGFENPALGLNAFTNDIMPGWTGTAGGADQYGVEHVAPPFFPAGAPEGVNVAYLQAGSVYQDLAAVLTVNTEYNLSLQVGGATTNGGAGLTLELLAGTNSLAQANLANPPIGSFAQLSLNFDSLPGNPLLGQTLRVQIDFGPGTTPGALNQEVDFDNVILTTSTLASSAPLPGSAVMGTILLAALGALRRSLPH
jgi:hypothetical protein